MNKSQHAAALANLTEQLTCAQRIVEDFAPFALLYPIDGSIGEAWNAAHDMVSSIEAQIQVLEINGYGRSRVSPETQALVSANID